ncbi:MAG: gamma-glutamylcyclotransferase family protein [Candidatus Binatia bacterium]
MMSERVWYFAYGSNMQPGTFAGRRGITPSRAVAARARDWRLALDKTPLLPMGESFANLLAEPGAETWGVAYEITADDLAHIDLTEGVLIGNYGRIEVAVESAASDGPTRAFTLTSDKRSPELIPSEYYMALLIEGAETHGLPPDWIAMLRAVRTCVSKPEVMAGRKVVDAGLSALRRLRG